MPFFLGKSGVETRGLVNTHGENALVGLDAASSQTRFYACREKLEARVGIEPTHKGFADLSLTTWVPRLAWGCAESRARLKECNADRLYLLREAQSWEAGAGDRGRTGDIFLGKEALYH